MSMLHKRKNGVVVLANGKWSGKTLEEVAKTDPTYLTWVYKKASSDLRQELFYELKDIMTLNKIAFEFQKRGPKEKP